jgi:hypothetical protein
MMKWGLNSGTPADSYYEVRSDCTEDVPKSKFKIKVSFFSHPPLLFFFDLVIVVRAFSLHYSFKNG